MITFISYFQLLHYIQLYILLPEIMSKDIKKTHEENRAKVCAVCWNERGFKPSRQVSDRENQALQDFLFPTYDKNDVRFPRGLCNTDRDILYEWINNKVNYLSIFDNI